MARKRNSIDSRIDYSVVLPVFFLLLIGLAAVYIATLHDYPNNVMVVMTQQVVWMLCGCIIAFIVMLFSTELLWKITPYLYILGLFLMVLPLIFYSPTLVEATGSKNWVTVGSVTLFQPSEFMKISYILMLACSTIWFHQKYQELTFKQDLRLIGTYALITLPVMLFLALQKDLGTAMVFVAILAGMILIAGISWWLILPVILFIALCFLIFIIIFIIPNGKEFLFNMGMDTYQINRISAWLDPFSFSKTIAYQQTQSMVSIGIGGLFGRGFGNVALSVPVRESDMIFTVIAEDFGFIGSAVVLGLYLLLIYRMIRVTFASNNRFYVYISTGFIMMILFHILENIGAAIGLLPLTGIPLPFISQGGSALITNLIGVGLVLSMGYQNNLNIQKEITEKFLRSRR